MKVKELIESLKTYNQEAEITVIAHCKKYEFDVTVGGSEGTTKDNTKDVGFYVDALCKNENLEAAQKEAGE